MEMTNRITAGAYPGRTGPGHLNLEEFSPRLPFTGMENPTSSLLQPQKNPSSASNWAADLLHLLLKNAQQQWDQQNNVIHQLQPDQVKDLALDIKI